MKPTWPVEYLEVLCKTKASVVVPRPHMPLEAFRRARGLRRPGCIGHWRCRRGAGALHAVEYEHHFNVHWDRIDPKLSPLGHTVVDVAPWIIKPPRDRY